MPDELKLPKWVNVSKDRFNEILIIITKTENNGLKTNVDRKGITLDNAESLVEGIASGKINGSKFKRKYNNIVDDVEAILQKSMITRSKEEMVEILSPLSEILRSKEKKRNEQPDTTDMTELESEESVARKEQLAKGLMLNR